MTEISLQFTYGGTSQRPSLGLFIPGSESRHWLQTLLAGSLPLDRWKCFPVPTSRSDNRCIGLVALADISDDDRPVVFPPGVLHYGAVNAGLYAPVDCQVMPRVTDGEWKRLTENSSTLYVWHPAAGLVAFQPDEALTIARLIERPTFVEVGTSADSDWGHALQAVAIPDHLTMIRAEFPASVEVIITESQDGIGTKATELKHLTGQKLTWKGHVSRVTALIAEPFQRLGALISSLWHQFRNSTWLWGSYKSPTRQEDISFTFGVIAFVAVLILSLLFPGFRLFDVLQFLLSAFVFVAAVLALIVFIGWLLSKLPPSFRAGPSLQIKWPWGNWGTSIAKRWNFVLEWSADLLDARRRELNRLKRLLEDDPDEGLKYALPLNGDSASRGLAPPTSQLVRRQTDFQFGSRGSGPADPWGMSAGELYTLSTQYRKLALREIGLGRFRRAAYIYADLLGDYNSAASALHEGKYFREAALIYRDKLNRPLDAAKSLEMAGLFPEAIEIYHSLELYEREGDLYSRQSDDERANAAFRRAVTSALNKDDRVDAARILSKKLQDDSEALAVLDNGWPNSRQAALCLSQSLERRTALGRNDRVRQIIHELTNPALPATAQREALGVLAAYTQSTATPELRPHAADGVRVIASHLLRTGDTQPHSITNALLRTAPNDWLLARDCKRMQTQAAGRTYPLQPTRDALLPIKTISLSPEFQWTHLLAHDSTFIVIGDARLGDGLRVMRGCWNSPTSKLQPLTWTTPPARSDAILFAINPTARQVWMIAREKGLFASQTFPSLREHSDTYSVCTPQFLGDCVDGLTLTESSKTCTFRRSTGLLSIYGAKNYLQVAEVLPVAPTHPDERPGSVPMTACRDLIYIAVDDELVAREPSGELILQKLPSAVRTLTHAPQPLKARLIATTQWGAYIISKSEQTLEFIHFAGDWYAPICLFLRSGRLLTISADRFRLDMVNQFGCGNTVERQLQYGSNIVAAVETSTRNQVAMLTGTGEIQIFEMPH